MHDLLLTNSAKGIMHRTFIFFIIVVTGLPVSAQKYTTAVGLRIGSGFGISVQQRLWDKYTAEAIVQKNLFRDGTNISALVEQHNKLLFKGLNFYIGAGPHVGLYSGNQSGTKENEPTQAIKNAFGF